MAAGEPGSTLVTMSCLGWLLVVIGVVFVVGYYLNLSNNHNKPRRNLGCVLLVIGIVIVYLVAVMNFTY